MKKSIKLLSVILAMMMLFSMTALFTSCAKDVEEETSAPVGTVSTDSSLPELEIKDLGGLDIKLLWPEMHAEAAVILMFLLPPPFVLPVFADGEEQRAYVSAALSVSTLVAIAGFAVLAMIGL